MLDRYFPIYILVFLLSMLITTVCEKRLIPFLKSRAKQPIYADGPSWHNNKSGTPTMGGLAFIIGLISSVFLAYLILFKELSRDSSISLVLLLAFAVLNSFIGIIDDLKKLKNKKNEKGLLPIQKISLQFLLAALFLFSRSLLLPDSDIITFSFGDVSLGVWYYPISIFILLGMINSVNLTDGIDGLASSVTFAVGISLFYISCTINTEVSVIASAIIGSTIGFLFFNLHPAKIFMGDTGSLFFGALISGVAFSLGNPFLIIFVGGVYAIEGISVVLQVLCYKTFKKRIFKMSPIHHHFEKLGWSENKICIVAIISTFVLSIPAYIFYLP